MSVNKLKYFFAVDTAYVAKKLGLLVFPYTHQVSCLPGELLGPLASLILPQSPIPRSQPPSFLSSCFFPLIRRCCCCRRQHQNWEVQYSRDVPLPPRQDLNAPDLYIPSESLTWAGACGQTCALRHREERGARVDSASALGAFVCGFRGVSRHRVEQVDRVG